MGANVWPADAVTGAPSYTGRVLRQLVGGLWARNPSRPLCGVSGVVQGTLTNIATATSSTWTVTPFVGVIDGEASALAGAYNFSFDTNQTGSVTAADATNPRVDLLYVKVSDPAEGDGSTNPAIQLLYLAGTAAASPVAPATPARSFALATILVPKSGTGSPSVSWVAQSAVAAGGVTAAASSTFYPANPYVGQYVDDPVYGLRRWTGAAWAPGIVPMLGQLAFSGSANVTNAAFVPFALWNSATVTPVGGVTWNANGLTVPVAGTYAATGAVSFTSSTGGRVGGCYTVNGATFGTPLAGQALVGNVTGGMSIPFSGHLLPLNANDVVSIAVYQSSGGTLAMNAAEMSLLRVG